MTVGQINQAAGAHGLVAVIGNDDAVGMAGLMLGGGYGPLMNRFGLACDNLLSAELVLPDRAIATCDDTKHSEFFRALRGGGENFGVVTSARIRLHRAVPIFVGNIIFDWSLIYGTWMPGNGDAERHRSWVRQTDATLVRSALPGGGLCKPAPRRGR